MTKTLNTNLFIVEVTDKKNLKKFIKFPLKLYKNCKQYVPDLYTDQVASLTKTPSLEYCKLKMWLVMEGDEVVGRIAGIINPRYNEIYSTKRARFNWVDFVERYEVAELLFRTAEEWAKSEGMTEIHGPLSYNTWGKQGMLIEGYENVPQMNCIYNYPYYKEFTERYGFVKEVDWIQYQLPAMQYPSEKIYRINNMLLERYPLRIVSLKEAKKRGGLIERFFKNYNETFKNVFNFVPLTEKEILELGNTYIRLLKPELTCFVMDDQDRIAAFGICFPSLSKAFQRAKGRLLPFGWYHIVRAYFRYDQIDLMMVGADPHWQSKGVSAIYHVKLSENFRERGIKSAISNPVIESNSARKVWDTYEVREDHMLRRSYIKSIN